MPTYHYYCEENGEIVEVMHGIKERFTTWGDLCFFAGIKSGNISLEAPITRLIGTPQISAPHGNADLKNLGMKKLVKRDSGVYENVTATGNESKIVEFNKPQSYPHLPKSCD